MSLYNNDTVSVITPVYNVAKVIGRTLDSMLMRNGTICYGLNEVLSHYRIMSNSLSSNKWKSIRQVWEIQTQDEGINKVSAAINVCFFIANAFVKHFL